MLTPEFNGWPQDLQICINEIYKMQHFISFDEFKVLFKEKTGKSTTAESSFLKFKNDIKNIYGKIETGRKYPPPIQNKKLPPGTFQSSTELFEKKEGSKNVQPIFRQHKIDPKTNSTRWEKSLQDPSITIADINKSLQ